MKLKEGTMRRLLCRAKGRGATLEPKKCYPKMRSLWRGAGITAGALLIALAASSVSADILNDWDSVKAPPKPELKEVTVDPSTTALLIMDLMKQNCGARPRCVATIPNVKRLHDAARKAGVMVWYSLVGGANAEPSGMIDQSFAPKEGEWARTNGPDKFMGTDLEAKLKAKGIKTAIICGTSFQGVGIGTGSGLAQRGYKVIVPIDCLSSEDVYNEQYAAWHMFKGGPAGVTMNSTLTRSTMIKF
jgi:nicotinamidase-related amidase